MASTDQRIDIFERLPVRKAVLTQILPAIFSQMIALLYNLADTYFVGMLNEPAQTAAVTVAAPAFVMTTAVANLFGVGGASLLAGYLGKKSPEKAKEVSAVAFWCGLGAAILFSLVFFLLAEPILRLCGAGADTYSLAYEYAKWVIVIGEPVTIMNALMANLIRAEGAAFVASIGVSLGGILNIILDPLFVLPRFLSHGAVGAGMATAISNMASMAFFILYIRIKRGTTIITLKPDGLRYTARHIRRILSVGFPSAAQYALTVVAISAQMHFVSKYDTEAIAALGIIRKLDQLPLYFSIGVANGLLPLLAYNHAAGNHRRRRESFRFGCLISVCFALACLAGYEAFAPQLVGLFIDDAHTISYGAQFLRLMVVAMPMMAFCYPMIIQFQAMGYVKESLICSILRKGVLDIPLLFLMNHLLPLYGCMLVQPLVDMLSLIAALCFYRRINRELSASCAG